MPPRLVLQFLGLPQLYLDNQPIATDRRKAIALLAYLAVNNIGSAHQRYSRESLSALLWPDYEQAKAFSNLRRTIWEIHQALGEGWLVAERESVQLNPDSNIDLDVAYFQRLLSQSRQQSDPGQRIPPLSEAVKLYRNHFLTGFSLKDAYPFNEWTYAESEELRHKLADTLILLVESRCTLNQAESAIPHARRLVALDPLNESAHRQLMEVYIQAGQHSAALRQYQTCEQILRKELNLDPQPETRALYKKIRKGEARPLEVEKQPEFITPRHNLPAQLSTFIGREKEQVEIMNLIAKHRLVTLVGVGGIGKTRLSLQVGQKLLNNYPNGVWFIELDSLSDPALVPQTVASVFDIKESHDYPITEILKNFLREKAILLIVDNCEHVLEGCAQLINALLTSCPNIKVLATSRETLNIAGEAIYYMPALSLPDQDSASLETLAEYEAIKLFAERAMLAFSSFTLTKENAQTVANICHRVDGIPLAIELAAARVNILQVDEILKQLVNSFSLLASNSRIASQRHQTLRASMDWSWGLLSKEEQIFLQQLSVFAGGWTLESAQAVCEGDALNLISALVKKSLIMVDQESGRETRYRFHEIVRQYARERLVKSGEEEKIGARHLKYFLQLSEQAESALRGPAQIEWYKRLHREHDNIRAALEYAGKKDHVEAGLYLSSRLGRFWDGFNLKEGERWLDEFLGRPESKTMHQARAKALFVKGSFLGFMQQLDEALSAAQECLALYRICGDQAGEIDGLLLLGSHLDFRNNVELTNQALALARSHGDIWRQASALESLGWNQSGDKRFAYWEQAITLFQQSGDWRSLAVLLSVFGNFVMLYGNFESAQKRLDEAALLNDQLDDKITAADILYARGRIAMIQGEYNQARIYLEEELKVVEELGAFMGLLWCRTHLGYLALREGNLTEARGIFVETTHNFQRDQNIIGVVFSVEGIAELYIIVDKIGIAARLIGWANATREKIHDLRPLLEQADVDKIIAACLAKMGEVAFSDAYDEGQKMTLDEAVAYALEEK